MSYREITAAYKGVNWQTGAREDQKTNLKTVIDRVMRQNNDFVEAHLEQLYEMVRNLITVLVESGKMTEEELWRVLEQSPGYIPGFHDLKLVYKEEGNE